MTLQFRKKPVVIFAWQNVSGEPWPKWLVDKDAGYVGDGVILLRTLEGDMKAQQGDWIILGVKGEVYPCKDSIFRMTYEPV